MEIVKYAVARADDDSIESLHDTPEAAKLCAPDGGGFLVALTFEYDDREVLEDLRDPVAWTAFVLSDDGTWEQPTFLIPARESEWLSGDREPVNEYRRKVVDRFEQAVLHGLTRSYGGFIAYGLSIDLDAQLDGLDKLHGVEDMLLEVQKQAQKEEGA